jgi:cyclin-dependent kinase 2
MTDLLFKASNGLYKYKSDSKIGDGAYSKIYDIIKIQEGKKVDKENYIVKVQKIEDRDEAINEIRVFNRLKKNKDKYLEGLNKYFKISSDYVTSSKIIEMVNYYIDNDYIYIILKKHEYTLDDFNILYNREFKSTIPINLCKKIINSIFLGLYELSISKIIHCDLKPNNILLTTTKPLKQLFNDIKKKKLKPECLIHYLDIKIIDFNLSQKCSCIYKSTTVQTTYYMAPEIILCNNDFNNTIDIWSLGVIIFELVTGRYLFDIFDNNTKYDLYFENYTVDSNSNKSSNSSESSTETSSTNYYNDINNLAALHYYREILGDNIHIKGKNIDKYYINKRLFGTLFHNQSPKLEYLYNYYLDIKKVKIDKEFHSKIYEILNNIFQYNIDKRLSVDDYLSKYKFDI